MGSGFTHLDGHGNARMVDVTAKASTHRRAVARCHVLVDRPEAVRLSTPAGLAELESARVAGTMGAGATSTLIPLCHPISLGDVRVDISLRGERVEIRASAQALGQTGVEMEALTACAASALTVVANCWRSDPPPVIDDLHVAEKSGGRSGHWRAARP